MILLVDDIRSFADGRECVVARSSRAAIRWLEEHPDEVIDKLWLDYDLGGFDSGQRVAEALIASGHIVNRLVVHSRHPEADRMVTTLNDAGCVVETYKEALFQDEVFMWIPPNHEEFDRGVYADE